MSVCSLVDVPKTRISPLPRTTRPRPQKLPPIRITPHRYLPRRQTAPKLLQQSITYTYSLYKDYSTFPLTSGDGTYQVGVYENVSDDRYTTLLSETFSVTLTDPLKPYLYPNQYVNFTADFLPVAKAEELADGASSDLDIISSVYNYIITHFTYDYSKASSVTSGYLPDIDEVFTSEKGICFDYAAVMTFLMIAVILVLMQKSYLFFPKFMPNSEAS